MKDFHIWQGPSEEAIKYLLTKMGVNPEDYQSLEHPQEDYHMKSSKYPIYVVADGVTLIQYIIDDKKTYPNPSPSGDVARIFCESLINAAEQRYEQFSEKDIKEIFSIANDAVGEYNKTHGRTKETIDYWNNDLYAATAAFVVIKDNKIFWGSICDSYITQFDKEGKLKFISPECHSLVQVEGPGFEGSKSDLKAHTKFRWRTRRNKLTSEGMRTGYGVVTGEPEAVSYFCSGVLIFEVDDLLAVYTDGFEYYMKLPEFINLFKDFSESIVQKVNLFTNIKEKENALEFGKERSLYFIKLTSTH